VKFLRRLRWQLTISHLLAIAFTLMSMIAALVFIVGAVIDSQNTVSRQPASDARNVAGVISGLVQAHANASDLDPVLRGIADGNLRMTIGIGQPSRGGVPFQLGLTDVAYIVLLDPGGAVLASSDPSGVAFSPPERGEWTALLGTTEASGATTIRTSSSGPAAFGAAPITDGSGTRIATVVLAVTTLPPPPSGGLDFFRGLAVFGVTSVVVLLVASVFALVSATVVAVLLARPLVRRLERLGAAAERLAHGDLSQRVEAGPDDEIGQLAQRFNRMAADLEQTLGELRAERDRVSGLLDDRRQLVASASHELRTPVATVRGYLESALARTDQVSPALRADLETMERELGRLQQLIEDLFALSQAEVGKLSLRMEPIDVGPLVGRLVETAAPLAWRQRRVQLISEISADVPRARADQHRLEQIVSNLLGNAIRHTPPGGLVATNVSADDGTVRLEVRDTGEGIRAEDVPHVWERFFRGRSEHGEGGAGLGLALVKELTEAMDGTVEVSSTPGEGSTFTVRLPAFRASNGMESM
jgi:signal transduction histidine kinase